MNNSISKSAHTQSGKLIVIDGGDGSGKATQSQLLYTYLLEKNFSTKLIDFPNYESFYGKMIAKFLRGEMGTLEEVSPYLASLMYACDRALVRDEMNAFLEEGGFIISDRYISASMAHQGAKFKNEKEQSIFLQWLAELEYNVNQMPKETIVIYLYVPWEQAKVLTGKKASREYLQGEKTDIQEKSDEHRKHSEKMYLSLAQQNPHWVTIHCIDNGELLTMQAIHKKIIQTLQEKSII